MGETPTTFEGYSYRTSSRFGCRVTVSVEEGKVSVTGPRVGVLVYRLWIAAQALMLGLAVLVLVAAVVLLDWRLAVAVVVLLGLHFAVGGVGAGCLWELQDVTDFALDSPGETATFSVAEVEEVRIGDGWARRGMKWLLLPYYTGINAMARGLTVSFMAPDGTSDGGVYAIQMRSLEEAQTLADLLIV